MYAVFYNRGRDYERYCRCYKDFNTIKAINGLIYYIDLMCHFEFRSLKHHSYINLATHAEAPDGSAPNCGDEE